MLVNRRLELENQLLYFVITLRGQELRTQVTDSIFSNHRNVPAKDRPYHGAKRFCIQ